MTERILTVPDACKLAEIVRVAQRKGRVFRTRGEGYVLGSARHIGRAPDVQGHPREDDVRDLALIVEVDAGQTEAWPISELIAEYGESFGNWVHLTEAGRVNLAPMVEALKEIRENLLSYCRSVNLNGVIPPTELTTAVMTDNARRLKNIAEALDGKELR